MKPILFNTEMVHAILDGRKTVTRRVVKFLDGRNPTWTGYTPDGAVLYGANNIPAAKAPYRSGDILYVRETWAKCQNAKSYVYKADFDGYAAEVFQPLIKWHPSIHMPRKAARIFLRVTDVRVERLQEIDENGAIAEGLYRGWRLTQASTPAGTARQAFMWLWQHLTRKAPSEQGWAANPWVWVIEFERCEKPEDGE